MNTRFDQAERLARLTIDHKSGAQTLFLLRFNGTDYLNDLFSYTIETITADNKPVKFDDYLGKPATIEFQTRNDGPRYFDGIITSITWAGTAENGERHNLVVRPWLWLATQRRNQRIFHEKSVVQIVEEVLGAYDGAFEMRLKGSYDPLEYTVQYRESDFNFISRMLERFGISYYFKHEEAKHVLVMTDDIDENDTIPGDEREYIAVVETHQDEKEHFWEWQEAGNVATGAFRSKHYNFKFPNAAMEVDRDGFAQHDHGHLETYDYPGQHLTQAEGRNLAKLRLKQERYRSFRSLAVGDCASLSAGMVFKLKTKEKQVLNNRQFLCLRATHSYASNTYGSGAGVSEERPFGGEYLLAPKMLPMVPEVKSPIPTVLGPQTAKVVGEGEIDVDEFGRILVLFHWDLNEMKSMRCRVSQNWASAHWGGMVIPRIGMEVIVEFLEGNPDEPMVTGCVYNGRNKPPYPLPDHKTRSVFRTNTHEGKGFNEVRFEDKAGAEEIFLHAQKDMNTKVLHNNTARIDQSELISVGKSRYRETAEHDHLRVGGSLVVKVTGDKQEAWAGAKINGHWQGLGAIVEYIDNFEGNFPTDGDYVLEIAKNQRQDVGVNKLVQIGKDLLQKVGGNQVDKTTQNKTSDTGITEIRKAGKHMMMTAGNMMKLEATNAMVLKVGGSSITLTPGGIALKTSGFVSIKAGGPVKVKGAKIDLN